MDIVSVLLFAAGALVVGVTLFDALCTTIAVSSGGPLTTRLAYGLSKGALRWHHRRERSGRRRESRRLLARIGFIILISVVSTWILLLWTGFMLLFSADSQAVVSATTGAPATFWERLYFIGFTVSTLGLGDFVPQGSLWRIATTLASLSGLFLMTLSITYFVPVISAVVEKRQLAASIAGLGLTPQEIMRGGWDGQGLDSLEQPLVNLAGSIEMHAQRHLAYPVLHFFHSAEKRTAIGPRVAALSEALQLMRRLPAEAQPPPASMRMARNAIDGFLDTLQSTFVRRSEQGEEPEWPTVEALCDAGLPVADTASTDELNAEEIRRRRHLLRTLVEDDGWTWEEVTRPEHVPQEEA